MKTKWNLSLIAAISTLMIAGVMGPALSHTTNSNDKVAVIAQMDQASADQDQGEEDQQNDQYQEDEGQAPPQTQEKNDSNGSNSSDSNDSNDLGD